MTALVLGLAPAACADRSADVLATVNVIARALADDNAPGAMEPFAKTCRGYHTLQAYFAGLTDRGQIVSEIDVTDETDTASETKVTIKWTMTITNNNLAGDTEQRTADLHLTLIQDRQSWKISAIDSFEFFNPSRRAKTP